MQKILVAIDSADHSHKITDEAIKLAEALNAEVKLLSVYEDMTSRMPEISHSDLEKIHQANVENIEKFLHEEAEQFREKGIPVKTRLDKGHPGQVICDLAKEGGFSYVVLGNRGKSGVSELLLGSVSNRVAHCAETNVILIK